MKIIEESDPRYKLLPGLWSIWNYDNIIIPTGMTKVVIPKELVIKEKCGKVQLSKTRNTIVSSRGLSNCIDEFLGITAQEFFDLMILHINDTNDRPKCRVCNKPLPFISLKYGYDPGSRPWNMNQRYCCSRLCHNRYLYSREDLRFKLGLRNPRINALTKRKWFLNKGNPNDPGILYKCIYNNELKFGITCDPDQREHRYKTHESQGYEFRIIELFSGTRLQLANLEFLIKSKFDYKECIGFDQESELDNLVKSMSKLDLTNVRL